MKIRFELEESSRIDQYLKSACPDYSRSLIQKEIKNGNILVNGAAVKANYLLKPGDEIMVEISEPQPLDTVVAKDIAIDILYEDDDFIFVNKPKGMVVHPAPGHYDDTLVNALLYHAGEQLSGINGVLRPGIVHRIDRDTTGVLVVCKNDQAHQYMARLLAEHDIRRSYRAIVYGVIPEDDGTIDAPIGRHLTDRKKMAVYVRNAKPAVTHYHVLERFQNFTYIECRLETGRTHQIRVHMASIHHPVLGDEVYGKNPKNRHFEGQTLHAYTLGFRHFRTGEDLFITAPLPAYFEETLSHLRQYNIL